MNGDVMELKRPAPKETKGLADFLDNLSEEELLEQLDGPSFPPVGTIQVQTETVEFEKNSRLTLIKMLETVPTLGAPFVFYVRRYCGDNYIQSIRTEISRARKWARDNGYDFDEPFRLVKVGIETRPNCDAVTLMRVPKGQKMSNRLEQLAHLMGSHVEDEDDA